VRSGERGEGQHFGLGLSHQRTDLGEPTGQLVTHGVPGRLDGRWVGLGEDGPEDRGDHVLVAFGDVCQQVSGEVHPAALVPSALKGPLERLDQAGVLV